MANNFLLQLVLKASDQASRTIQSVTDRLKQVAREGQQSSNASAQASTQAARTAIMTSQRIAQARLGLGIRSEHQIQREIQRTIAQYNRLKRSGTASSRELASAAEVARKRIRELNNEMGKTSTGQRLMNVGKGIMSLGVGAKVGYELAKKPITETADYNLQLAYLANTAYSGKSKGEKKVGMEKIHHTIKTSLQYGGNKETALEALNALIAQGKVSVDDALELLPTIQKNAIATGASTTDIVGLVNAGLAYGINKEQIQDFIDYANASGKAGGFELRDMAQYAPALFATAQGAGLKGMDGAKQMFKMLQQIYNVSGGSSETATNTMNFLAKLNSQDTQTRAQKIKYVDKKGKQREIDLKATMSSYMSQGKDTVEAFLSVVDDILVGDKGYQEALKNLEKAKNEAEKTDALNRVADYLMGSRIGELVADRQAWLGLFGIRSQRQTAENVEEAYQTAIGSTAEDWEFISEQAAIRFQQAQNTVEMGKLEAFKDITDFSGEMALKMAEYGSKYPELTSALIGATESVKILGGAAITAAGSMALLGGRSLFERGIKTAGASIATSTGRVIGSTGRFFSSAKPAFSGGLVLGALAVAGEQQPYQQARSEIADEQQSEAKVKFAKAVTPTLSRPLFQPAPFASKSEQLKQPILTGGYLLADIVKNNQVARARYELGNYSQSQYEQRLARNQTFIQQMTTSQKPADLAVEKGGNVGIGQMQKAQFTQEPTPQPKMAQTVKPNEDKAKNTTMSVPFPLLTGETTVARRTASELGKMVSSVNELDAKQITTQGKVGALNTVVESVTATLAQYQADFATFGKTIADGLQAGLAAQSHTIDNRIVVELDGRIIAENTSQHFFNFANRGTA